MNTNHIKTFLAGSAALFALTALCAPVMAETDVDAQKAGTSTTETTPAKKPAHKVSKHKKHTHKAASKDDPNATSTTSTAK